MPSAISTFFWLAWRFVGSSLAPMEDQMRRLEEFTADVSHELRTPMAVIRSSVELARRTGEWGDAADEIEEAAGRMEKTSSSLLRLATLARAPGDEEETDLRASVAKAADSVRACVPGKSLETSTYLAGARPSYRVARRQWEICLENLVGNAAKHARTRVTLRLDGGTLEVDDDGPGIAPENLPKVFDRFWQERRGDGGYGGYGVGLAIVRKICELRGWEIAAGTAPEGGARFTLRMEPPTRGPWWSRAYGRLTGRS